jgi:hypothetical protein
MPQPIDIAKSIADYRADYFVSTADQILQGDGIRLLPGTGAPLDDRGDCSIALHVMHVGSCHGLTSITVVGRSFAVGAILSDALGRDLPTVSTEVSTIVLNDADIILLRG